MNRLVPFVLVLLLWAVPASAQDAIAVFTLCSAQTTVGACDTTGDTTGSVINTSALGPLYTWSFYGTASTASTYSCDVYSASGAYDSTDKQKMNSSAITNTNQYIALEGLMDVVWIECTTITGGTVTVVGLGKP